MKCWSISFTDIGYHGAKLPGARFGTFATKADAQRYLNDNPKLQAMDAHIPSKPVLVYWGRQWVKAHIWYRTLRKGEIKAFVFSAFEKCHDWATFPDGFWKYPE